MGCHLFTQQNRQLLLHDLGYCASVRAKLLLHIVRDLISQIASRLACITSEPLSLSLGRLLKREFGMCRVGCDRLLSKDLEPILRTIEDRC